MRYYDILITDPATGAEFRHYTSLTRNGTPNPGALNVEIDAQVTHMAGALAQDSVGAYIRIWGVSLADISQATDFGRSSANESGKNIVVKAGMVKGLPLATQQAANAGVILRGRIYSAIGNWIDTVQTLDLNVFNDDGTNEDPKNLVLFWAQGMNLGDAVKTTLQTAFPTKGVQMQVDPRLISSRDDVAYFKNVTQLAQFAQSASQRIIKDIGYTGVQIFERENDFIVGDGSSNAKPKTLLFNDLIGQPTWIGFGIMQATLVMRADIVLSDYVEMPRVIATAGVSQALRDKSSFTGIFQVNRVRHVGNFRDARGLAWITVVDMAEIPPAKVQAITNVERSANSRSGA